MRWHEDVLGKFTSAAGFLFIFYNGKIPIILTNMGFNVRESYHSSSFAMEIIIMLPYVALCGRVSQTCIPVVDSF